MNRPDHVAATITHGRHCTCSACERQDWTEPQLACCGMHGPICPPVYAPLGAPGQPDPSAARDLLEKLDSVLAPLDSKIDFSLHVGTIGQMRADLSYLRGLLGEAHAEIRKVLDADA